MPTIKLTGVARIPLLLLDHAEELGLDATELADDAKLTELDLGDPDSRVPVTKIEALWRSLIERRPDVPIGLRLGQRGSARGLGLVGYTMAYSPTLRESLRRLERYSQVISEAIQCSLEEDGPHSRFTLDADACLDALRHPIDARMAAVLTVAREITGRELVPLEVWFSYARPADVAEHRTFFRGQLEFDRPRSLFVWRNEDLELPVVAADETLSGYLDRLAEEALEALGRGDSFLDKVRKALWVELSGGRPTLERTATVLGVSARTLQRRLGELGTSFSDLLDKFRRDMSTRLLRNESLAVYEVAFLLGYSEPSTFYRAFRRWTGVSPVEYRRSL